MEITYPMIIESVIALIAFITMWYPKGVPKDVKYFCTVLIITIILVGVAFVYLNDKINSLPISHR